ncbi:Myeloid leukemia factor 1 [Cricetulus griseus]|uniref:Myeloid leukemia factor 1 n=1 Tax=Cricetulus griseus TaxID=10029 RepID=G3I521_CRIGR|nr:Myeloid leukemia factor 1 [Cricetulus griseus]
MFRMLGSSFEDDPFFADSFLAHRENMRHMMRSFSEPFGRDTLSICDGRRRTHNHRGHNDEDSLTHTDVSPFQAMDRMMFNMQNGMQELQRNFVSTKKKLMRTLFSIIDILYCSDFQTSLTIVKIAKLWLYD